MSHELRTPLNSLLILARLLADNAGGNLNAKQVQFAQTIYASGMDLLSLINDLLDLAKIEAGALTALTLAPARLEELREDLERGFRQLAHDKGLQFAITLDPAAPAVIRTDLPRLKQVLKNLLANAFKFTKQGSVRLAHRAGAGQAHRLLGDRHRHRHPGRQAEDHLRSLPAGRRHHQPPVRRHGARPVDQPRAHAAARRRDPCDERAGQGQHLHAVPAAFRRSIGARRLRILVLGASGFIGRHAAAALRAAGHDTLAAKIDFTRALRAEDWLPALRGVDAVLNAVGIIRERGRRSFTTLHYAAPRALFDACTVAGVRRVVQISALGADESARSRFHRTKRRADEYLAGLDLDWAIVQPSIVFGEGGDSARLFTLLAALPLIPVPGDGRQSVQPIHVDDLVEALVKLVSVPMKIRLHAVGPRALTLREWLRLLRAQMGLGRARFVPVPLWLVPVERETLQMLQRGNTAPPDTITQLLRRAPRDPSDFLDASSGAALALRARLDWLLPLLRFSIGTVWIVSGVVSLGPLSARGEPRHAAAGGAERYRGIDGPVRRRRARHRARHRHLRYQPQGAMAGADRADRRL